MAIERGTDILSGDVMPQSVMLSELVCLPSEKEPTRKGKNLCPEKEGICSPWTQIFLDYSFSEGTQKEVT